MRQLMGLALAGAIVVGAASTANAQFGLTIGNPYTGSGIAIGGGGWGYPAYGYTTYNTVGSYYVAPGTTYYSSGYVAPAFGVPYAPRYGYRPYPSYGGYRGGYGGPYRGGYGGPYRGGYRGGGYGRYGWR